MLEENMNPPSYCGYVAIIGRPNVGKSTLLNRILQQKLCITSRKPQTTRHTVLGIQTIDAYQAIYVDTPGLHLGEKKALNVLMNKTSKRVLHDVDVVLMLIDAARFTSEDEYVLSLLKHVQVPCFLVINKVDTLRDKGQLLPLIQRMETYHPFRAIIPISAKTGQQVTELEKMIYPLLPEGPHLFEDDQLTDRPLRFLCAELLREKIFRLCGQELPYSTSVEIESYQEEETVVHIHARIWVEKENHKRMIIGHRGEKLKAIATAARLDIEKLVDKKIFLQCWCKVKSGWSEDVGVLRQFGYD
jgi:GTPase